MDFYKVQNDIYFKEKDRLLSVIKIFMSNKIKFLKTVYSRIVPNNVKSWQIRLLPLPLLIEIIGVRPKKGVYKNNYLRSYRKNAEDFQLKETVTESRSQYRFRTCC